MISKSLFLVALCFGTASAMSTFCNTTTQEQAIQNAQEIAKVLIKSAAKNENGKNTYDTEFEQIFKPQRANSQFFQSATFDSNISRSGLALFQGQTYLIVVASIFLGRKRCLQVYVMISLVMVVHSQSQIDPKNEDPIERLVISIMSIFQLNVEARRDQLNLPIKAMVETSNSTDGNCCDLVMKGNNKANRKTDLMLTFSPKELQSSVCTSITNTMNDMPMEQNTMKMFETAKEQTCKPTH